MSNDRFFEFSQFTQRVCSAADDVINPGMTVAQADAALRALAVFLIDEHGGAALLLHLHPELLETSLETSMLPRPPASGRCVIDEVAIRSLVEVMEPVRRETFMRTFEDGIVAATERLLDFTVEASAHARAVVTAENVTDIGRINDAITMGTISENGLVQGLSIANSALRKLSILDDRSRIAMALGGTDVIRDHADAVEKLLQARMTDPEGFFRIFLDEIAGRETAPVIR
jgi:hypothetical protein